MRVVSGMLRSIELQLIGLEPRLALPEASQ